MKADLSQRVSSDIVATNKELRRLLELIDVVELEPVVLSRRRVPEKVVELAYYVELVEGDKM